MKVLLLALGCFIFCTSFAQFTPTSIAANATSKIDSLNQYSYKIINDYDLPRRLRADSMFTKIFVRALKEPFSFQKTYDSLQYISVLTAPDQSFRIFTWQLMVNENLTRQHGAIQMNTADGRLKLFPLIDKSDITQNMADTIANHTGWIGAVYYKLLQNSFNNKNYYTLIGYDANNIRSEKKIIEVLHFENEKPIFGGNFFAKDTSKEQLKNKDISRYILEFKKFASPRLNYDSSLNLIVMEHLISQTNEPKKKYTLIPDGDYEGFTWKDGKWVYIKKIFNEITPEGLPPTPDPVNKEKGLFDF